MSSVLQMRYGLIDDKRKQEKDVLLYNQHCTCWWTGVVRWQGLCRHSDDQLGDPYIYGTGTLSTDILAVRVTCILLPSLGNISELEKYREWEQTGKHSPIYSHENKTFIPYSLLLSLICLEAWDIRIMYDGTHFYDIYICICVCVCCDIIILWHKR